MTNPKVPILRGSSSSDYENYLRTDELLALQKSSDNWVHRDELLFTVVHQVSELWLKLATVESEEGVRQLKSDNIPQALRLVRRAILSLQQTTNSLELLEKMSPGDYQQVRQALGHGSGFDSPGFNTLRKAIPGLGREFFRLLDDKGIDLLQLYLNDQNHEDLFQLAETLLDLDENIYFWRIRHLKIVGRSIGMKVSGTQGTPVEVLEKLTNFTFFPELLDVRTTITNHALEKER